MIAYPRLGKVGRLGNQLFQVAFLTSFSTRFQVEYRIPPWRYAEHFAHSFSIHPTLETVKFACVTKEPAPGYHQDHFVGLLPRIRNEDVAIETGYFQSFRYFSKQHVMKIFEPRVSAPAEDLSDCVAISVRRGDFVWHPLYANIEAEVYLALLDQHFAGCRVFVFSDDFNYCRRKFIGTRFSFFESASDIVQLNMMAKFRYFILSNSTFSYWGPMLSPEPKKVLYPRKMFSDPAACDLYNNHYWPNDRSYVAYDNEVEKPYTPMKGLLRLPR